MMIYQSKELPIYHVKLGTMSAFNEHTAWVSTWGWVKTLVPSEPQNSW